MCKHALCEHGSAKPAPPSLVASTLGWLSVFVTLVTLVAVSVVASQWLPRGTLPSLVVAALAYLVSRTFSSRSFQLSAATLHTLSQEAEHQAWMAKGRQTRLEIAERLGQAIRLQTVSYDRPAPAAKAEESKEQEAKKGSDGRPRTDYAAFLSLHALLKRNYPLVHQHLELVVINSYSLVYRWRSSSSSANQSPLRPILLTAHLDVVPALDTHLWDAECEGPFSGKILNEEFVCGRGAIDDKQAVCGIMEALESLLEGGHIAPKRRDVFVCFGHDEEISGFDGAAHIAKHLKEVMGVEGVESPQPPESPFSFLLDEGLFVMDGMVPGVRPPVAMVCVAEKGFLLNELSVAVPANLAGHASTPPKQSAIGILASALVKLEAHPMPTYLSRGSPVRLMFESVAPHASWPFRFLFSNLQLLSPLLRWVLSLKNTTATLVRTTTALTVVQGGDKGNMLPREARALVNHRLHPEDSVKGVMNYTRSVINDERVRVQEKASIDPAPVSSHTSKGFRTIQRALGRVMPEVLVAPALMVGNTDTHHYWSLASDIYRFSPTRMNGATIAMFHGANERINIDNYVETIAFYRAVIQIANEDDTQ